MASRDLNQGREKDTDAEGLREEGRGAGDKFVGAGVDGANLAHVFLPELATDDFYLFRFRR